MRFGLAFALLAAGTAIHPALMAQTEKAPRAPRGVYAKVDISKDLAATPPPPVDPNDPYYDQYFSGLFGSLLADPAISGLTIQIHWSMLQPDANSCCFWNYLEDAFSQVSLWNTANPNAPPKTIQIVALPGYQSPTWLLNQIPLCDPLFVNQTPPSNCGTITTAGYQETVDQNVLPLPWNQTYKNAWQAFLVQIAARNGSNLALVSVSVAGPTAASSEITTFSNTTVTAAQPSGLTPNQMRVDVLQIQYPLSTPGNSVYQRSDQAFIDEWENAINLYAQLFSGITSTVTTGAGLPDFGSNYDMTPTVINAYDCSSPDMQCFAVAAILSYFAEAAVGGQNGKGTQSDGMTASRETDDNPAGIAGARWLAGYTAPLGSPSTQVLGGADTNGPFSGDPVGEGCLADVPPDSSNTPAGCNLGTCNTNACVPTNCPRRASRPASPIPNWQVTRRFSRWITRIHRP